MHSFRFDEMLIMDMNAFQKEVRPGFCNNMRKAAVYGANFLLAIFDPANGSSSYKEKIKGIVEDSSIPVLKDLIDQGTEAEKPAVARQCGVSPDKG